MLLHYLKQQYNRFLWEVEQLAAPLTRSLALTSPSQIGCRVCDKRASLIDKNPLPAILRMRDSLTFIPPLREREPGFFSYDRLYTSLFKYFPSGEREARASARRMIARLNQGGGALALEPSYKMVKSFMSGHTTWLTPYDLQQDKLTYMSTIAILSLHNETTACASSRQECSQALRAGPLHTTTASLTYLLLSQSPSSLLYKTFSAMAPSKLIFRPCTIRSDTQRRVPDRH